MKDISQKDLAKARKIAEYFGVGIDDIFLPSNTINNSKSEKHRPKKLF